MLEARIPKYKNEMLREQGATLFLHFDEKEIITIDVSAAHAEDKRVQSIIAVAFIEGCHYKSGESPLLQLNELRICHAFKLIGQKVADASESL